MDLSLSEEQCMLQDVTRKVCEELAPLSVLRELEGTEPGYSAAFWQQLGELGLTGLMVDEAHGGLGLGALETVVVNEEFGRLLTVSPHHSSSVMAASLIAAAGDSEQKKLWLPAIASGEKVLSVASSEPGAGFDRHSIATTVSLHDGVYRLSGTKHMVPFAASAHGLIVLARLEQDPQQVLALIVECDGAAQEPGVSFTYLPNHAREPLYKTVFNNVAVPAANVLHGGQNIWPLWEQAMSVALIPLAAFAVGAARQVHAISVEYAKYREAFGRAIGGFQAIAHYLADVAVAIEGAGTLVYQAAWARDQGRPYQQLAAMAKLQACDTFCKAAAVAIQVHGGMGYTSEADPQLFFRRAKQLQLMNWDTSFLERRIADGVFSR